MQSPLEPGRSSQAAPTRGGKLLAYGTAGFGKGVAQGVAGFATNPFDALKTRVQAGAPGVGAALRDVLRADGPRGLMRGAGMRVLWIGPQGSVYYPAYEAVQRLLS